MTAATQTETETFTFTSLRSEFLLYLTPDRTEHHSDGTSETVNGIKCQFGNLGGFEMGKFETDDPELVERLRKSPHFNQDFFEIKVVPVAPDSTDDLVEVAMLIAGGDVDALQNMLEKENAGWEREPVLNAISGGLSALQARERPDDEE